MGPHTGFMATHGRDRLRFETVDVFTDAGFSGNQLAVVLGGSDLSTGQMQQIAAEFGYSETSFVLPSEDDLHDARVRIFTPAHEVPFAGHPNVGTAFVLALESAAAEYRFLEGAGTVTVTVRRDEDGRATGARLRTPAPFRTGAVLDQALIAGCLGLTGADIRLDQHEPVVGSCGLPFLFVQLSEQDALARVRVDVDRLVALTDASEFTGVSVYALRGRDGERVELTQRVFAPGAGVPEDPATGSAASALACLRAEFDSGEPLWLIEQGQYIGRPSRIEATVSRQDEGLFAHVAGNCVSMMSGTIRV